MHPSSPSFFPGLDLRERAAELLIAASPLVGMSPAHARVVVDAMRPIHLLADTLLFEEGDAVDNDYLVLVLEGPDARDHQHRHAGTKRW